jgi:DNA polymerase-1
MSRYVFDIETNGLLRDLDTIWIISMLDINTGEQHSWLPHKGEMGWVEKYQNAALLIGHNIKAFDILAIEKVYGVKLPRSVATHDTLVFSMVLDYLRFGYEGHSMERWGEAIGEAKQEHEDWTQYSEEMRTRCESDVRINYSMYQELLAELLEAIKLTPNLKHYIKAEHFVAEWCGRAELKGWPFDRPAAQSLFEKMRTEVEEATQKIEPRLGLKAVPKDKEGGEVILKEPKWTKAGCYNSHTASWFGVDPWSGYEGEEQMILGPFCRVEFKPLLLTSINDVKIFLHRNNWQPTEWNYKKRESETGKMLLERTSPKITEDSLEVLGGDGKLYCDYLTTSSRFNILKTWLNNLTDKDTLHGKCFPIGTPSMRARHSIIVNVPSSDSAWGKEMRQLFKCQDGWSFIGADSAGNQARGLAHYLNDPGFIDVLLNGDIHQYNADRLTEVLATMGITHTVPRSRAKRVLYAFLFGASGAKLWSYVFDVMDAKQGNRLKEGFLKAVPGFKNLIDKLTKIYTRTQREGQPYIRSIAGNKVYVDSKHKLLVYLLQACEKATCSAALMLTMIKLEEENIPYNPFIFMHDEIDFEVPDQYKERAAQISKEAFKEGPKLFGVNIMDGDAKIGSNWYECH